MPAAPDAGKFRQWWPLTKQAASEFFGDKAPRMSAALAYYTAFALAPMLVIAVFITRVIIRNSEEARSQVIAAMGQVIGGLTPEQANQILIAADKQGAGIFATILSVLLAIVGASGVFAELQDSLNSIWDVKPKPHQGIWGFIRTRVFSLAMLLSIAFVLLTSLAVSTFITGMSARITGGSQVIAHILDFVLSVAVTFVLFGLIFKVLPDVKLTWAKVWRGALVTAVLFTIGKILLGVYLGKGSATSAFGAAASLAALLIWINYSAWILFFGAEFTKAYVAALGEKVAPSEHAVVATLEDEDSLSATVRRDPSTARSYPDVAPSLRPISSSRTATNLLIGAAGCGLGAAAAYLGTARGSRRQRVSDDVAKRLRELQGAVKCLGRAHR